MRRVVESLQIGVREQLYFSELPNSALALYLQQLLKQLNLSLGNGGQTESLPYPNNLSMVEKP